MITPAVYEIGADLEQHAKCQCHGGAFGVAVVVDGTWFLHTSRRWVWDSKRESFYRGRRSQDIPGPGRRGPAQIAMPNTAWSAYGREHGGVTLMVPLPTRFICPNDKCGKTNTVVPPAFDT